MHQFGFLALACGACFSRVAASNREINNNGKRSSERLHSLQARGDSTGFSQNTMLWDSTNSIYVMNITIGTPPQKLAVQIDTGSGDLWVPAAQDKECKTFGCGFGSFDPSKSSTFQTEVQDGFLVQYYTATDFDRGDWVNDTITVGEDGTMSQELFGLAFSGNDTFGVLGLANFDDPLDPLNETYDHPSAYPGTLDGLVNAGRIGRKSFGLYLNDNIEGKSSITFGGVDTTKYTGDLVAMPLVADGNGLVTDLSVAVTGISFTDPSGQTTQVTDNGFTRPYSLDTGTYDMLLDPGLFTSLARGFGAIQTTDGWWVISCGILDAAGSLNFEIGGQDGITIKIPFKNLFGSQIYDSSAFSDKAGACNFQLEPVNEGFHGVLGDTFLRAAYTVFDLTNNLTALARAVSNAADTSSIITMAASETTIPGATKTGSATITNSALVTGTYSIPADLSATSSGSVYLAGTPTFNLGSVTKSDYQPTSSTTGSSNNGVAVSSSTWTTMIVAGVTAALAFAF